MKCPSKSHPDWLAIVAKYGEISAMKSFVLNNEELPTLEQADLLLNPESGVNYNLKSFNILLSDRAKQIFDKGNKVGWDLNKILTELSIPKEQKQLLLDIGSKDRDVLALELASKYSYSVEVNTAKLPERTNIDDGAGGLVTRVNPSGNPASYYSNLTVQGGTNYTENEISTPLITPSIKGHAQFSTDKGIGWFRSDEQINSGELKIPINDGLGGFTIQNKTSRILEVQSDLFQKGRNNKDLNAKKTNIPSIEDIEAHWYSDSEGFKEAGYTKQSFIEEQQNQYKDLQLEKDKRDRENQFLQLLNKDNNWVTFFIKSIIQDSAKKGYEKVLFPRGETAAKIEGHQTIADEISNVNNEIERVNKYQIENTNNNDYAVFDGVVGNSNRVSTIMSKQAAEEWLDLKKSSLEKKKSDLKSQGIEKLKPIEAFYEIKVSNVLKKNYKVNEVTDEYGNKWNEVVLTNEHLKPIELQREVLPPTKDELDSLKKQFNVQNSTYDELRGNKRVVGINKWLSDNDSVFRAKLSKSPDGSTNIISFIKYASISHSKGSNLNPVTKQVVEPILKHLQSKFGLNYRFSNKIKDIGQFDPNTNEVIINPDLVSLDTPFHEFAHPFVSTLKEDNPVLYAKLRYEILKEGKIFNEIKKTYSDYTRERQIEEAIVTAIGRMSAEEYSKSTLKKAIDQFLQWILNTIRNITGIGNPEAISQLDYNSTLRDIAKLIVGDNFRQDLTDIDSYDIAAQRKSEISMEDAAKLMGEMDTAYKTAKEANLISNELNTFEAIIQKAVKNLEFKRQVLLKKGIAGSAERTRYDEIVKELESLRAEDAIINMLAEAKVTINQQYKRYSELLESGNLTIRDLSNLNSFIIGYEWLDDVKAILIDESNSDEKGIISDTFREQTVIKELLATNGMIDKRNKIIKAYTEQGVDLIAKRLIPYSNWATAKSNEQLELVYNKLPKEDRSRFSLQQYKDWYNTNNKDILDEYNLNYIKDQLRVATKDINWIMKNVDNILDSPDVIIAAACRMFSDQIVLTNTQQNFFKQELVGIVRELEELQKQTPFTNIENTYSFMLEKEGKDFTGHYVTKYKSTLKKDYGQFINTIQTDNKIKEKDKYIAIAKKKDELAPRNDNEYYKARWNYIDELLEKNIISKEEYDQLAYNDSKAYHGDKVWELLRHGQISSNTAHLLSDWEHEFDWVYREPIAKYKSTQWDELKKIAKSDSDNIEEWNSNDPRIKLYKFIVKAGKEADAKVPSNFRLGTRLPGMEKTVMERVEAGQSPVKLFTENFANLWKVRPEDQPQVEELQKNVKLSKDELKKKQAQSKLTDAEGNVHRTIPIHYTQRLDPKDMSFDVATLYMGYWGSATKYYNINKILPELEWLQKWQNNPNGRKIGMVDSTGKSIESATSKKSQQVKDKRIFKPKGETNIADMFNAWMSNVVFEETNAKTRFEKALDTLSKYTAFRVLALNPLNAMTNVLTGETLQKIETIAHQYVSPKSYLDADVYYYKHSYSRMKDIGSRYSENMVSLLNEKFRITSEDSLTQFRKSTKVQQLFGVSKAFFMLHAGDDWMQNRFFLAMLAEKRAYDSNGNDIGSMLEMYKSKDGHLQLDEKVDLNKSKWTDSDQNAFSAKVRGVLRRIHGAYGEEEKIAIQQYAVGRMVYQFRKFMVPGFRRRWDKKVFNNSLGEFIEGNYRTFGRFVKDLALEVKSMQFELMKGDFSKYTKSEKANIIRTASELAAIASIVTLIVVLESAIDDDKDKDETWFLNLHTMNFAARRTLSELTFFSWPPNAMQLLNSPAASYSILEDTGKLLTQTLSPTEVYQRGPFKGENKLMKKTLDLLPMVRQIFKITNINEQASWMKQIYGINTDKKSQ